MGADATSKKRESVRDLIRALVEISRHYGADREFVLAGGGNTSVKTAGRLYVKASGCALATIGRDGFVELDRRKLVALLDTDLGAEPTKREERFKQGVLAARVRPEKNQRPSIESLLHNLLPARFVVHTHPARVNMLTCCQGGEALAGELFGDEVLWVPYTDPGCMLARALRGVLHRYAARTGRDCPPILLIQNHGLIVCGQSTSEVRRRTAKLIGRIRRKVKDADAREAFGKVRRVDPQRARTLINAIGPALRALLGEPDHLKVVRFDDSELVLSLAGAAGGRAAAMVGPVSPDHLAYCTSFPLWFVPKKAETPEQIVARLREAIREHTARRGLPPRVVLVKGLGMFASGDDSRTAETPRVVYRDQIRVMAGACALGGIKPLTRRSREFIEGWEVEKYRLAVAAGPRHGGKAAGRVAVVTGAAQGFGLEIARDLAAEGAHVALADINAEGARSAARELCERHGGGRAVAVEMNVTDGQSVADALHQVVRTYGGLDLLISNAGVLRAGSVKTQPARDFEFVTRVNYTGYFLCVRSAAPILALQRLAAPEYWSDIIQINSKSGLAGSNRNAAYAGSKFGGIGLTQSFALELIADGVKVNSVCPGNFFDGPLWSDPRSGLFVQYLRAGKVPGARTIADVRRLYEGKVPMKRGCTAADVMKAIYYLMDQKYETGQAVPVTGGQVMLR